MNSVSKMTLLNIFVRFYNINYCEKTKRYNEKITHHNLENTGKIKEKVFLGPRATRSKNNLPQNMHDTLNLC